MVEKGDILLVDGVSYVQNEDGTRTHLTSSQSTKGATMDTRPRQDFKVERDEHGQRYAFPTSAAGEWYFSTHLGDFDLSELGWELDVNDDAMPKFEKAMADSQLVARGSLA